MHCKNRKTIMWPFGYNSPGQTGTHLTRVNSHPHVGLERSFLALSYIIKKLSSHLVIKYQKETAQIITGPEVVIQMV